MCWIGKNDPKKADKDLRVFKFMICEKGNEDVFFPVYTNKKFKYNKGETETCHSLLPTKESDSLFTEDGDRKSVV